MSAAGAVRSVVGRYAAVFVDRDGTIAKDNGYCARPEDLHLFPESGSAIKLLKDIGFKVIVVTNQSGIGRGLFSESDLTRIHNKMHTKLEEAGAFLDDVYFCPHHPDEGCFCRKPRPGMLLEASQQHIVDLSRSVVVGDKWSDMNLGWAAGCRTIYVSNEQGQGLDVTTGRVPDAVVPNIFEAAHTILKWTNVPPSADPLSMDNSFR